MATENKPNEALLIVEKLAKSHDGERMLIEGLTFTLGRGERLSIVGENGAGKSTLLRMLAGEAHYCFPLCPYRFCLLPGGKVEQQGQRCRKGNAAVHTGW